MKRCIPTQCDGGLVCQDCGRAMKPRLNRMCKTSSGVALPAKPSIWQQLKAGLLGDVTETILSSVGLTKERWEEIIGGPCGCGERQEWLNKVGQALTNQTPDKVN